MLKKHQCNSSTFSHFNIIFMQLFITEYTKKNDILIINNVEILSQVRKVLRAKIGDIIRVQNILNKENKTRYELRIERWDDKHIE